MNPMPYIRMAAAKDVPRILEIYSPFILNTSVSFETKVPTLSEFNQRLADIQKFYPWLVCEVDGMVAGYTYASAHQSRCAYSWSADTAVYVDPLFHRRNVGRSLYQTLLQTLQRQGFYNAFAGITLPNPASEALHRSFGFTRVGVYKDIGHKHGQWHDVIWYQLQLQKGGIPKQPIPVGQLSGLAT